MPKLDHMNSQELSNLLWGLSKLLVSCCSRSAGGRQALREGGATEAIPREFLSAASECVHAMLPFLTEQGFSCCSLSLKNLGFVPDDRWLGDWVAAGSRLMSIPDASSQAISSCLCTLLRWSEGRDGWTDDQERDVMLTISSAAEELARRAAADGPDGGERAALLFALASIPPASYARQPRDGQQELVAPLLTPSTVQTAAIGSVRQLRQQSQKVLEVPADSTSWLLVRSQAAAISGRPAASSSSYSAPHPPFQIDFRPDLQLAPQAALDPAGSVRGSRRAAVSQLSRSLACHMQRHAERYKPGQLALGLWSLARTADPETLSRPWLLAALVPFLDRQCTALSDKEMAMFTWAKLRLDILPHSHLRVTEHASSSSAVSSNGGDSSGEAGTRIDGALKGGGGVDIRQLSAEALASALHASASGAPPAQLPAAELVRLKHLVQMMPVHCCSMTPRSLTACLHSVARLGFRPQPEWQRAVWSALHAAWNRMTASELSLCLWAMASMRCRPSDRHGLLVLRRMASLAAACTPLDVCRLLQAASAWRLGLQRRKLWPRLAQHVLYQGRHPLAGRQLVAVLLHAGRLGLPLSDAWLSAAYGQLHAELPGLGLPQLVSVMEAMSLLQVGVADGKLRSDGSTLSLATLSEVERRGLALPSSSCSDDARFLRCLMMHRRQSRWLDVAALDATLTSFFIITRRRLAAASTRQLLHLLFWLAELNATSDEDWLGTCRDELRARFRGMAPDELSWALLALVKCGCKPSPSWIGLYMGVVLQRMPLLQEGHVTRITTALGMLDARLHQRWRRQLVISYS